MLSSAYSRLQGRASFLDATFYSIYHRDLYMYIYHRLRLIILTVTFAKCITRLHEYASVHCVRTHAYVFVYVRRAVGVEALARFEYMKQAWMHIFMRAYTHKHRCNTNKCCKICDAKHIVYAKVVCS